MSASIITTTSSAAATAAPGIPSEARATRSMGAAAGALVAGAAALLALAMDAPLLALGLPAATVAGFWLGPQVRSSGAIAAPAVAMGALTVLLADALLVAGAGGLSLLETGRVVDTSLANAIGGGLFLFLIGLIVVGSPMLAITIPCGLIWAAVVRRFAADVRPHRDGS
jgi:hypothetical protein